VRPSNAWRVRQATALNQNFNTSMTETLEQPSIQIWNQRSIESFQTPTSFVSAGQHVRTRHRERHRKPSRACSHPLACEAYGIARRINERTKWPTSERSGSNASVQRATIQARARYWGRNLIGRQVRARQSPYRNSAPRLTDSTSTQQGVSKQKPAVASHCIIPAGWPGSSSSSSIVDPRLKSTALRTSASDAFYLVIPSFRLSGVCGQADGHRSWDPARIALAWVVLMTPWVLKCVAQGGGLVRGHHRDLRVCRRLRNSLWQFHH